MSGEETCSRCKGDGFDPDPESAEPVIHKTVVGGFTITTIENLACRDCNGNGVLYPEEDP